MLVYVCVLGGGGVGMRGWPFYLITHILYEAYNSLLEIECIRQAEIQLKSFGVLS